MPDNRLLASLPGDLLADLSRDLEEVSLPRNRILVQDGYAMDHVYFPTTCLICVITPLDNGATIETLTIGADGFLGLTALLGLPVAYSPALVSIAGDALRMPVPALARHLADSRLREVLGAYAVRALISMGQSAACVAFHSVEERLAHWLLVVEDSIGVSEFPLTQEALAQMLGVHRPTISIGIRLLESAGLVEHRRGNIRIVNREGLLAASCECYEALQNRFNRLKT